MPHDPLLNSTHVKARGSSCVLCIAADRGGGMCSAFPDGTAIFSVSLANNNTTGALNAVGTEKQAKGVIEVI